MALSSLGFLMHKILLWAIIGPLAIKFWPVSPVTFHCTISCMLQNQAHVAGYAFPFQDSQQAMTNYFDLNMENNMRMRDTQFFGMFCLKTVENQIKC
jgi:hypothetical protein